MKYKSHSCITAIQNQFKNADTFYITELDIEKEIEKLNTKKLAKKFLYIYILYDILCKNINNSIKSSLLPSYFKTADITPMYKKSKKHFKGNYKSVSSYFICSIQAIRKNFV